MSSSNKFICVKPVQTAKCMAKTYVTRLFSRKDSKTLVFMVCIKTRGAKILTPTTLLINDLAIYIYDFTDVLPNFSGTSKKSIANF